MSKLSEEEWTTLYLMQFGESRLNDDYAAGELEFYTAMREDLELGGAGCIRIIRKVLAQRRGEKP